MSNGGENVVKFNGGLFSRDLEVWRDGRTYLACAPLLGVSDTSLFRYEKGERVPNLVEFMRICLVLGFFPQRYFPAFQAVSFPSGKNIVTDNQAITN